ncbi:MAG: hypothetical protein HZA78_07085 [Candidatus Schekmanbacteria bacterium]|nr:hypothetical protein [Candidatus Schekmanbacteria bacterium]
MQQNKKLLILILNREEYLEDILALFLELGISGATILESIGMGRIVTYDIPVFAGFRDLMIGNRPYNKTILSVVDDEIIPQVVEGVKSLCSDTKGPGVGLIFTLPVCNIWRLTEE